VTRAQPHNRHTNQNAVQLIQRREAMSNIAMTHINAKIETLTELLAEIDEHDYTRAGHVVAHIRSVLGVYAKTKDGVQYEIDARADNKDMEQFNGKV